MGRGWVSPSTPSWLPCIEHAHEDGSKSLAGKSVLDFELRNRSAINTHVQTLMAPNFAESVNLSSLTQRNFVALWRDIVGENERH